MDHEKIIERVRTLHPDAVIGISGEDCSFQLSVVSQAFTGQNTLQRQQPILALFKKELRSGAIHALTIKALTPYEEATIAGLIQIRT
jgi:acid stress-induced BolA-like protein IbaG/YrbA